MKPLLLSFFGELNCGIVQIRRGKNIGVCPSVDNCRLFVGGIPKTVVREQILAEMQKVRN